MTHNNKTVLGVIGGLGPMATAYFMELVVRMTDAAVDQEHIEMLVSNCPSIPDRTGYLLGKTSESPLPKMLEIGEMLARNGAGCIAIPCITAHCFYEELSAALPVPVIHAIRETALHLKENGVSTAGIIATDGTIATGIISRELERQGIAAVIPSRERQKDAMHLIYNNIKANRPAEMDRFHATVDELRRSGAETIILGCTELALIQRDHVLGPGFINAMEVLAQRTVLECGAALKDEYRCLISI